MVFSFESLSAFVNVNLVMTSPPSPLQRRGVTLALSLKLPHHPNLSPPCSAKALREGEKEKGGVYLVLGVPSSETVSFFLPFLLRAANTLRPLAEAMRSRKPCLLVLFFLEGWNVRFIIVCDKPN